MNILSSPIWPSDMPDERRVIALLGLVQISEDGMSADINADNSWVIIERLENEVERLNALVAMKDEALEKIVDCPNENEGGEPWVIASESLSATPETVSAWQSKRDVELAELQRENADLRKQLESLND